MPRSSLFRVADRRRILLAVEPRVFGDALAEVLTAVGLDEVLVSGAERADESPMHLDAAIVSRDDDDVVADVVIHVTTDRAAHVTTAAADVNVSLRSPHELLSVLDRYCPTVAPRVTAAEPGGAHR